MQVKKVRLTFFTLICELFKQYESLVFNLHYPIGIEFVNKSWIENKEESVKKSRYDEIEIKYIQWGSICMNIVWKKRWKICNGFWPNHAPKNKPWIKIIACNFTINVNCTKQYLYIRIHFHFVSFVLLRTDYNNTILCPLCGARECARSRKHVA